MNSLSRIGKKNHGEASQSLDVQLPSDVASYGVRMTKAQTRRQLRHVQ